MKKCPRPLVDPHAKTQAKDLWEPISQKGKGGNVDPTLPGLSTSAAGPSIGAAGPSSVVGPSKLYNKRVTMSMEDTILGLSWEYALQVEKLKGEMAQITREVVAKEDYAMLKAKMVEKKLR